MSQVRNEMVRFIRESLDPHIDTGVDLSDEAKTSAFVFLCLDSILHWSPYGEIIPQKSASGFIDYELRSKKRFVDCWVEVKKFDSVLKGRDIRKYLVRPGRAASNFRISVLTNLHTWKIFGYSPYVGPSKIIPLVEVELRKPSDFKKVEKYISYEKGKYGFVLLKRRFGESAKIVAHELMKKELINKVVKDMRSHMKRNSRIKKVPQNMGLKKATHLVLKGKSWKGRTVQGLTFAEVKAALTMKSAAASIAAYLKRKLGANCGAEAIRRNLREYITPEG